MSDESTKCDNAVDMFFLVPSQDRGIIAKFCGTYKTRDMVRNGIKYSNEEDGVALYVFPSLALIMQFHTDYLSPNAIKKDENIYAKQIPSYKIMSICSSNELKKYNSDTNLPHSLTTNRDDIRKFLTRGGKRIITVTYASLPKFVDILTSIENTQISIACFDEAHHITSEKINEVIEDPKFQLRCKKSLFFTATPDDNMNMPIIYKYTHKQAVRDGVCSDFTIVVYVSSQKDNRINDTEELYERIYNALADSILATDSTRVLTFHHQVDDNTAPPGKTAVNLFHNYDRFEKIFNEVKKSYPASELELHRFKKITSSTKKRREILDAFDKTPDNKVFIISSCNTIGEGVDTKKAEMTFFADAKSVPKDVNQNIGRVTRGREVPRNGNVVSLCTLDVDLLIATAKSTLSSERDIIRAVVNCGNFKSVLDILNALRHYDNEFYDRCINNFTRSQSVSIDGTSLKKRKIGLIRRVEEKINIRVVYDDNIRRKWNSVCKQDYDDVAMSSALPPYDLSDIIEKGILTEFAELLKENDDGRINAFPSLPRHTKKHKHKKRASNYASFPFAGLGTAIKKAFVWMSQPAANSVYEQSKIVNKRQREESLLDFNW